MKAPAFQTYAADYYMDTAHWTVEEVGIYQRLLLFEWVNGPLPDDKTRLARIAGCSTKKFLKGWLSISIKFIPFGTCQLQNKRLEQTREIQQKYSESRRNNVSTRYKDKSTHVDTHVEHMSYTDPTLLSSSSSSSSKRTKTPKRILSDAEGVLFNIFWNEYPKKLNKGDAEKAWLQIKPDKELVDRMIENIKKGKGSWGWQKEGGQFIPYPATWLRAKGWENEYEQGQPSTGHPADAKIAKLEEKYGKAP